MPALFLIALSLLGGTPMPTASGTFEFALVAPDGRRVDASQVLQAERRLVVYLAPGMEPAARLAGALRRWSQTDPARWRERVIVIVAAPLADARAWLQAQWGDEEPPPWFADPDASGWRALNFQGSLAVAGIGNGEVEWKLDGVIDDPGVLERPVTSWVEGGAR